MSSAPYRTPFGVGLVHYDERGLTGITLPAERAAAAAGDPPRLVRHLVEALEAYYEGRASLLAPSGLIARAAATALLRDIYAQVVAIRPGEHMTYAEVAAAVGRPRAARAVGAAMARNPFPPVIPCHRVVGSGGDLRGYGGGLEQKRRLLEMEALYMEDSGAR